MYKDDENKTGLSIKTLIIGLVLIVYGVTGYLRTEVL